jgi:hypothetical protein
MQSKECSRGFVLSPSFARKKAKGWGAVISRLGREGMGR